LNFFNRKTFKLSHALLFKQASKELFLIGFFGASLASISFFKLSLDNKLDNFKLGFIFTGGSIAFANKALFAAVFNLFVKVYCNGVNSFVNKSCGSVNAQK